MSKMNKRLKPEQQKQKQNYKMTIIYKALILGSEVIHQLLFKCMKYLKFIDLIL